MSSICLVLLLCALANGYHLPEGAQVLLPPHGIDGAWAQAYGSAPQAAGRSGDVARAHGLVPSGAAHAAGRSDDAAGAHKLGASGAPQAARRAGDDVESNRVGASVTHLTADRSGDAAKVQALVASGAPHAAGRAGDEDEPHGLGASGAPQAAWREDDAAGAPDSNAQRSDSQDNHSEESDDISRASYYLPQQRGRSRYRYNNRGFGKGNYYPSYANYLPYGGRYYYIPRNGEDAEEKEAVVEDDSAGSSPNAAAGRAGSGDGCCGHGEADREGASYYNGPGGYVHGAESRHGAGSSKHSDGTDAEKERTSA